jgi:hypothetical protein
VGSTLRHSSIYKIRADSTWKNLTHLGTDYAALLVEPGYKPTSKIAKLPMEVNGVVAVVTAKGEAVAPVTPFQRI